MATPYEVQRRLEMLAPRDRARCEHFLASTPPADEWALIVRLSAFYTDPNRDQWERSDMFAIVYRGYRVTTAMFTRRNQLTRKHLRVRKWRVV